MGRFLEFGSNDPSIIAYHKLTSADEIGDGTIVGSTHTFDSVKGFLSGGDGSYINWDTSNPVAPVDGSGYVVQCDHGGTLSFELETSGIDAVLSQPSTYARVIGWHEPGKNWSQLYLDDVGSNVEFWLENHVDGAAQRGADVYTTNKNEFMRIDISFRQGYVDLFIDKLWYHTAVNDQPNNGIAGRFTDIHFPWRSTGDNSFNGYIRNLQISTKPINMTPDAKIPRLVFIGDSFAQDGAYQNLAGVPYSSLAAASSGAFGESGTVPEVMRKLSDASVVTAVYSVADGGEYYDTALGGANIIIDQVDGTDDPSALDYNPPLYILLGGANDTQSASFNAANFKAGVANVIALIHAKNPDAQIILCNQMTLRNHPTYAGGGKDTNVNSANTQQAAIAAADKRIHLLDLFTLSGGHTGYSTTFFKTNDFHPSLTGMGLISGWIKNSILTIRSYM